MAAHDFFAHKSKTWDHNAKRVQNARKIADKILKNINPTSSSVVLDLGIGTGLLSYFVSPYVSSIVGIDSSPSMLNVLNAKKTLFACHIEGRLCNIEMQMPEGQYDAVISSMTMHHIADIHTLFQKLYLLLKPGGHIAIADLDKEDGTFHSEDTGVYHFGFDRDILRHTVQNAGFKQVRFQTVNTIHKPHGDFSVFLMTARKES